MLRPVSPQITQTIRRTNSSNLRSPRSGPPSSPLMTSRRSHTAIATGPIQPHRSYSHPHLHSAAQRSMASLEMELFLKSANDGPHPFNFRSLQRGRLKPLILCLLLLVALFMCFNATTKLYISLSPGVYDEKKVVGTNDIIKEDVAIKPPLTQFTQSKQSIAEKPEQPNKKNQPSGASSPAVQTLSNTGSTVTSDSTHVTTGQSTNWLFSDNSKNKNKQQSSPNSDQSLPASPLLKNAAQTFVNRWCDLTKVEWLPTNKKSWQRRAPYVLFPGAKFSGVTGLVEMLMNQQPSKILPPHNAPNSNVQFFFESNFRKFVSPLQERTKVYAARESMYARHYHTKQFVSQNDTISFDASHGYLFYSTLLPRRILCVIPWVKLVIVLRNPTDRLYEHYLSAKRSGMKLSLEQWIDKDMKVMRQVGLVKNWTTAYSLRNFTGSVKEDEAWYEYQSKSLEGALGRSLYDIQLRQWFQAFRAAGRDPSRNVLILQAEALQSNPQAHYDRVLKFLKLPNNLPFKAPTKPFIVTNTTGMDVATRKRMDDFFKPYNDLLKKLLRRYKVNTIDN